MQINDIIYLFPEKQAFFPNEIGFQIHIEIARQLMSQSLLICNGRLHESIPYNSF